MIPEFISGKPSANRNASDALPSTESTSTDQRLNNAAFRKALQQRQTTASGNSSVSRDAARAADNPQPASRNEQARANATGTVESVSRRTSTSDSKTPQARNDRSTGLIRRIDPAELSSADAVADTVTSPSSNNDTVSDAADGQGSAAIVSRFIATDDLDFGTLPSLVRLSLDDVVVDSLPGDIVPVDATADGANAEGTPSQTVSSINVVPPETIDGPGPVLNDVLIPDSEAAGRDARFTSTEPFLTASIPVNAEAVHVSTSFEHDDLMSYPTLPSLRPDRVSTVQVASQIATGSDVPNSQRVENAAYEGLAGSEISAADDNLPDTAEPVDVLSDSSVAGDAATQLPSDFGLPGDVSNSDTVPLILPSLTNGVKRRTEANRETGKLASAISQGPDSAQLAIRDSSFRSQDVAAVSGVIPSAVRSEAGSGSGSSSTVQEQGASLSPVQPEPTPGKILPESAIRDSQSSNVAVVPSPVVVPEATRSGDDQQSAQVPFSAAGTAEARISQNRPQDESPQADTVTPSLVDTGSPPGDANTRVSEPVETTGGFALEPPQQVSPQVQEFANALTRPQPSSSAEKQRDADRVALKTEPAALVDDPRDSTADRREGESSEQRHDSPLVPQQASTIVIDAGTAAIAGRSPVVPERAATISADAVAVQTDLQSQSVRSVSTPNDQARVRDHVPQTLSDFREVTPVEARTENTADVVSAENPSSRAAPQRTQSLTPGSVRADAVLDLLVDPTDSSPSRGIDSGNASVSAVAVETGSADIAAATSFPGPASSASAAMSSGVGKTDSVRAPAVPMEIQDAVSAIQDATSGDSHIRVRLNPRALGHMLVDVSRINGVIVARLEVESAAARVAVLDTLPHLQHALTHSGASVDRIDVVLTESRAESGRQESNQSQPRDQQQSRHDRQSSDQRQARDEQNQHRQNQHRQNQQRQDQRRQNQRGTDAFSGNSPDSEPLDELDVKL